MAQIGACIGREFSYELLAAISPLKGKRLEEALEQLTDTGLVFRRGTPPDATYTFKHALVQDAAYDSLLKSKRAQLHAQIAQVLENDSDGIANEPELIARHHTQAGMIDAAIPHWRKAGEFALQRMALNEAIAHLNEGLRLNESRLPTESRDMTELEMRALLGTVWIAARGWADPNVRSSLEPALRLAQSLGRQDLLPQISWCLWVNIMCNGRAEASLDFGKEMLNRAKNSGSRS